MIIDDPMKGGDAASESARRSLETWYSETLVSRADNKKNNRELIVMQRLHVDDLSGILLERGGYQHLCLPAIAGEPKTIPIGPNGATWYRPTGDLIDPENEPLGVYESLKLSMGTKAFSAQYLQDPLPEENGVLKWEWFRTYTELPRASPGLMRWHASWDLAVQPGEGHDWSVGIIAVEIQSKLYIKSVIRVREALPYVINRIQDVRREHPGVTTYIEAGGNGPAAIQQLRHNGMPNLHSVTPRYSKEVRLSTISPQIERGMVHLPANASWLTDFKKEMLAFPRSTYDDQVDALSQLVQEVLTPRGRTGIMEMIA
jgi:predicted phage terminase large subunit-like protein